MRFPVARTGTATPGIRGRVAIPEAAAAPIKRAITCKEKLLSECLRWKLNFFATRPRVLLVFYPKFYA